MPVKPKVHPGAQAAMKGPKVNVQAPKKTTASLPPRMPSPTPPQPNMKPPVAPKPKPPTQPKPRPNPNQGMGQAVPGGGRPTIFLGGGPAGSGAVGGQRPVVTGPQPTTGGGGGQTQVGTGGVNPITGTTGGQNSTMFDPAFLQQLSVQMAQAQMAMSPLQAEMRGLTSIDPTTGLTRYQANLLAARRGFGQNQSSVLRSAAERGIGRSGMRNQNLAQQASSYADQQREIENTLGNARLGVLQQQLLDQYNSARMEAYNNLMATYSRGMENIPQIGG